MSDELTYKVGDKLRATKNIYEESCDYSPASLCASKGDLLIVRKISNHKQGCFPIAVSHEDRTADDYFWAAPHEVYQSLLDVPLVEDKPCQD